MGLGEIVAQDLDSRRSKNTSGVYACSSLIVKLQLQVGYAYWGHPELQTNANFSARCLSKLET